MISEVLEAHGERVKEALEKAYGKFAKKFVTSIGDDKVCEICLKAEAEGPIPLDMPFANGKQEPPFHGKTCRCKKHILGDLGKNVELKLDGLKVDVGFFDEQSANAAETLEYGTGNGPPTPIVRPLADTTMDDVFNPTNEDLFEHFKSIFMK
jgi:hypothetical protein